MLVEDASGYRGEADEIVKPGSEAEVIAFLERASRTGTPVTIAGAGTGVTGGSVPESGALLSLEKLNRLEIRKGCATAGLPCRQRRICRLKAPGCWASGTRNRFDEQGTDRPGRRLNRRTGDWRPSGGLVRLCSFERYWDD